MLAAIAAIHLIGWPVGPQANQEVQWEQMFARIPSAQNAARIEPYLSSRPHRAGTPADYATAQFVQHRLQADGFRTYVIPYEVQFTGPIREELAMIAPHRVSFDLLEGTPGHHTVYERDGGPPFDANSGDGDVTGRLYYVNHGSKEDLQALDALHVDLRGAIVLLRNGGSSYDELRKRGVIGIVHFYDPADDGYGRGEIWPHGNYKNLDMTERAGGPNPTSATPLPPGDVTLPAQVPLPGVAHNPYNSVPRPDIPELPITARTARTLLAAMTGGVPPPLWHPLFEMVQHIGGNVRVHLAVQMTRHLTTIWNVVGEMPGTVEPNSVVIVGSHRDALVYGAIDPGSGTTALLQVADGLHAIAQQGYRPRRTIRIISWDGHELGLFGSVSYAYQFGPQLRQNVVQYVNTDQVTTGDPFLIRAAPELYQAMKQIADVVPGPSGAMLGARDTSTTPLLNPASTGSDQHTFAYMLGIPSTSNGFRGPFGAHHSAEDNIPGIQTYDPGYKEAASYAIFTGIQTMRAAGATVMPLRQSDHAQVLLDALEGDQKLFAAGLDTTQLRAALTDYLTAAKLNDAALDRAEVSGDLSSMQTLSNKQLAARQAFYVPEGLAGNKYIHTLDIGPFGFPEIFSAHDLAGQQAAVGRLVNAAEAATAALK